MFGTAFKWLFHPSLRNGHCAYLDQAVMEALFPFLQSNQRRVGFHAVVQKKSLPCRNAAPCFVANRICSEAGAGCGGGETFAAGRWGLARNKNWGLTPCLSMSGT